MRVVVVGGGLGDCATAARLAKLGHEVTLLERAERLGGALRPVEYAGRQWDAAASYTLMPAVLRDLFRKSGRPLERELDLQPVPALRRHVFADDSTALLASGSRAAQREGIEALGAGLGQAWVDFVDSFSAEWEVLRRGWLERPYDAALAPRDLTRLLGGRQSLRQRLRRSLPDPRLRRIAAFPHEFAGHDTRSVPAWLGIVAHLEQTFTAFAPVGGSAALADALTARLATRKVRVLTGALVADVEVVGGRAVGVRVNGTDIGAEAVVCAIDPRRLPALAPLVERTMVTIPPATEYLGLTADLPKPLAERLAGLPIETVWHDDALSRRARDRALERTMVLRRNLGDPHAWTLHVRGRIDEDPVVSLARRGLDLRDHVVTRVSRSAREHVEEWGGSPDGVVWAGRGTVRHRLGPETPVAGLYAAGAHATPGGSLPFVGLSAALVAQVIGPA